MIIYICLKVKQMTTALVIGDIHFKEDSYDELILFMNSVYKLVQNKNPDFIVILGDTLHRHEKIHMSMLVLAQKFLRNLSKGRPLVLLIGNHDRINNSEFLTDESPFYACKFWDNIYVADSTIEFKIKNHRFICVPYVFPGRFLEALDKIPDWHENTTCVFAHQEIRNCSLGIKKSLIGDEWDTSKPLLISGHIHNYEKISNNMIYVGTPRSTSFGESDKKTVSLFTFGKNCEYSEERISLNLPHKETWKFTTSEFMELLVNDLDFTSKRVVIIGTISELQACYSHYNYEFIRKKGVKIKTKMVYLKSELPENSPGIKKEDLCLRINERLRKSEELNTLFNSMFAKEKVKNPKINIIKR